MWKDLQKLSNKKHTNSSTTVQRFDLDNHSMRILSTSQITEILRKIHSTFEVHHRSRCLWGSLSRPTNSSQNLTSTIRCSIRFAYQWTNKSPEPLFHRGSCKYIFISQQNPFLLSTLKKQKFKYQADSKVQKRFFILPRITSSVLIALLSMRVLQQKSWLYSKLPFELQNSLHSIRQPRKNRHHEDPMWVRTHIVWKIQALSS